MQDNTRQCKTTHDNKSQYMTILDNTRQYGQKVEAVETKQTVLTTQTK